MIYELHLLQPQAYKDLLERLEKLSPDSQALWGKMDVAQMLAHVTANLELALSNKKVGQMLMGRFFGPTAKQRVLSKGISKNTPTAPGVKISDLREFQREKERLVRELEQFVEVGEAGITRQPHPFFGRLTPNEWARLQYLHVDHHFKQFNA